MSHERPSFNLLSIYDFHTHSQTSHFTEDSLKFSLNLGFTIIVVLSYLMDPFFPILLKRGIDIRSVFDILAKAKQNYYRLPVMNVLSTMSFSHTPCDN